jgi:phage gpG-like protein
MATGEVIGTQATIQKIKAIAAKAEVELKRTVKQAALTCEKVAKEKCPVRTGTLRRSITTKKEDDYHYTVGTNITYAGIQEFRKQYMAQGAAAAEKEYPELVKTCIVKVAK